MSAKTAKPKPPSLFPVFDGKEGFRRAISKMAHDCRWGISATLLHKALDDAAAAGDSDAAMFKWALAVRSANLESYKRAGFKCLKAAALADRGNPYAERLLALKSTRPRAAEYKIMNIEAEAWAARMAEEDAQHRAAYKAERQVLLQAAVDGMSRAMEAERIEAPTNGG